MTKKIDFYFDFISPYSFLAHKKIINSNHRSKFNYKAILLGGLHNLGGITAPAFNERKMKNMKNDCNLIAKKNNIDTSGPFIGESYDAAAILILALQEKNFKSDNNLSKNIMSVSNSPGTKIYPGEIAKGLKLLKKGKKIDYEGATNVEFNVNGDAFGTFLEKEVSKGKFRTRQQR